jgi:hypothetical protein
VRPRMIVRVDDELHWVVVVPESVPAATRFASRTAVSEALERLEVVERSLQGDAAIDVAARAVAAFLRALPVGPELPELPFIGEPFGGQGGTD